MSPRKPISFVMHDAVTDTFRTVTYAEAMDLTLSRKSPIENNMLTQSPFMVKQRYRFGRSVDELKERACWVNWGLVRVGITFDDSLDRISFPTIRAFVDFVKRHHGRSQAWCRVVVSLLAGRPDHQISVQCPNGSTMHVSTNLPRYAIKTLVSDSPAASDNTVWMAFEDHKVVVDGNFASLVAYLYDKAVFYGETEYFIETMIPPRSDSHSGSKFQFLDVVFCRDTTSIRAETKLLPLEASPWRVMDGRDETGWFISVNDARKFANAGNGTLIKSLTPFFPDENPSNHNKRLGLVVDGKVQKVFPHSRELAEYAGISVHQMSKRICVTKIPRGERVELPGTSIVFEKL